MSEFREGVEVAGRFVILERIGEGGMGAVYRALQTSLDREVALKVLHSQVALTARARRRFAREARAIARLNHPHIASVYDFGIDESAQTLWLAMEMIEGVGMTSLKHEDVDLLRLLALTDQILSALSAAHARGIIHRDLKPSNVLIAKDDEGREMIKLVDFGLAATHSGELSLENAPGGVGDEDSESDRVILGTPRYMAPEIFRRAPADPRVDLYALGVMLFELLSGQPPFPGDDPRKVMRGHLHKPIPQLFCRDGISLMPELERAIYKLLAKDANERYQTAAEVRDVIGSLVSEFSYVPWMAMGPRHDASTFRLPTGNFSQAGFSSAIGGQTVAPASMMVGGISQMGALGMPIAPLVGRSTERRVLEERLRSALMRGEGSLIMVESETGMGKTRLLDWVKVRVEEAGVMRVVQGNHTRSRGGFSGMRAVLERLLGVDDYSPDDLPFAVRQALGRWDFTREEIDLTVRLLGTFGASAGDTNFSDQERVFSTIERILRRCSEVRPLLIILEDLHNAGELTIGFLEHLAVGLHLSPMPIVLMTSMRAEELDRVPRLREALQRLVRFGSEDIVRMELKRLDESEASQLVRKLIPVHEDLAHEIGERASGNPLHIMQVLRYLQESGKLRYESGMWALVDGASLAESIPDEIADMMRYRAEQASKRSRFPEAALAILERCAVLGQAFDYLLLRHMLTREAGSPWSKELDTVLEEMIALGIFQEQGSSGEDLIAFAHTMMRDVLLQDLNLRRSQRALHKLAADAKIAVWGTGVGDRALDLVYHFQQARDPRGVYKYTILAARHALVSCDLKAAMELFRSAEDLATRWQSSAAVDEYGSLEEVSTALQGEQVALEVAHLERRLGEYDSSRQDYRKLLASEAGEIALWSRWGLGDLALRQGDFDEAVSWFEAARRDAMRALQFPSADIPETSAAMVDAYCLYGLGVITFLRGDLTAAQMTLGEAMDKARACREKLLETEILRVLSDASWMRGEVDKSEIYRRRSLLIVERFGDVEELALSTLYQARFSRQAGQPTEAASKLEEAQASFESLGKRHYIAHCLVLEGQILWGRGSNKPAAQAYRKAHRFYEMFRDRRGLTECKYHLATLAFSIRRFPDTQSLVRDALEGYRAMGDRRGEAMCWLVVGRLERELTKLDKAERTFGEAAKTFSELGDLRMAIVANLLRALVLDEAGQASAADAILGDIVGLLPTYPVIEEVMGATLDALSQSLSQRRPDIALELDTAAELVWQRLGRPVEYHAKA